MADGKQPLTMSFGTPEPVHSSGENAYTKNYPLVQVLQALIKRGGSVEWRPIAVAVDKEQLDRAAGEWVEKFRDIWGGRMKIVSAPFVIGS